MMKHIHTLESFLEKRLNEATKNYYLWIKAPHLKKFQRLSVSAHSVEPLKKNARSYAEEWLETIDRSKAPSFIRPESCVMAITDENGQAIWVDYPYTEAQLKRNPALKNDIDKALVKSNISVLEESTVKWQDVNVGDVANVKAENRTGVVYSTYGRKFNLKFPDGTTKTYDANELTFFLEESTMHENEHSQERIAEFVMTFEGFIKKYGDKLTPEEFEKIAVGSEVVYKGTTYTVEENPGKALVLKSVSTGSSVMVNLSMFNHGGAIRESAEEEHPYYKGISKSTEQKKKAQMAKQAAADDDDPEAYKELPGDIKGKKLLKTSKHTKKYHELYK
jgi:hypothetical protein